MKKWKAREQDEKGRRTSSFAGRKEIILTCLESKVAMYEKFGFKDKGIAQSTWGGEEWHEMGVRI